MNKGVGLKIKEKRKAQCLTMETLASLVGVTKGYISQLENGKVGISDDTAYRLADVLYMDVSEIAEVSNKVDVGPEWLRFLKSRYDLTMGDERVLQEIARDSRMPLRIPGESMRGYRERWDSFYTGVMKYLSQPEDRFFADPEVRYVLAKLSISDAGSMKDIRDAFIARVKDLCGDGDGCESIAKWRMEVERRLNIKCIDISNPENRDYSTPNQRRIELGKIMVGSSPRIYGAIYRLTPLDSGYVFIGDTGDHKGQRGDYPFWHEVARTIVDGELNVGRVASYVADGMERAPIEGLFSRMAIWLAYSFADGRDYLSRVASGDSVDFDEIRQANQKIFRGATLRMTSMAVAEAFDCPVAYIDAQMRLKEAQFRNAGIAVDDLRSMASHKDAKLRLGYVFKNVAAEDYGVGLRYNMQAGEKSPISQAYAKMESVAREESLHDWPPRYNLVGFCKTSASYSPKKKNVRAFMCFQTESESL